MVSDTNGNGRKKANVLTQRETLKAGRWLEDHREDLEGKYTTTELATLVSKRTGVMVNPTNAYQLATKVMDPPMSLARTHRRADETNLGELAARVTQLESRVAELEEIITKGS